MSTASTTQKLHAIADIDDGWNLDDESPRDPSAETRRLQPIPHSASPASAVNDGYQLGLAATVEVASIQDAPVPAYWGQGLALPRPMELAQGTLPEEQSETEEAPLDLPVFWLATAGAEPIEEIKTAAPENAQGFSDADHAFFAEGEALSKKKQTVDEFVDLADRTLTFWQRFWKR